MSSEACEQVHRFQRNQRYLTNRQFWVALESANQSFKEPTNKPLNTLVCYDFRL